MAIDIRKPLQAALSRLKTERDRIDQQIQAIEGLLRLNGDTGGRGARRGRRRMTAAERREVSRRMKAYWAKRRSAAKKAKPTAA
ncbi:MAG TPA: hypothetical protein VNK50_10035 [Calidithermus sp.]|jgi:hypothetical protein|nr:hypothetical protein [Calidithermus sp.]